MPIDTEKVSFLARINAKPGERDAIVAAFEKFMVAVDAEEGTEVYSLHLDKADADTLWVFEVYTDQAAQDLHGGSPDFMELLGAIGDLLGDAPGMYALDPIAAKGITL